MLEPEREAVADHVETLGSLTPGRTGNLSVRRGDRIAITPSGLPYDEVDPGDVPVVALSGRQVAGDRTPSSETPMHTELYDRLDVGAVVHTHSPWATTLAVLGEPLPPIHYVLALVGGSVPVAEYATYGTEALAENVAGVMTEAGADACLLANHGLVATGGSLESALEAVEIVESVARVYCQAAAFGTPEPLPDDEMERVARKLQEYGPDDE